MANETALRRIEAGKYRSRDGVWTIVHNAAGWVAYLTDDPIAADTHRTLADAAEAIQGGK